MMVESAARTLTQTSHETGWAEEAIILGTYLKYTLIRSVGEGTKLPPLESRLLSNQLTLLFNHYASITAGVFSNPEYDLLLREMREATDLQEGCERKGVFCAFFGSARLGRETDAYKKVKRAAYLIARAGFGVITGGGPSIMEAANWGARRAGAPSAGAHIVVEHEKHPNRFLSTNLWARFKNFFVRRYLLTRIGQAYVFASGGGGTFDELFECLTLLQTGKILPRPVVLLSVKDWATFKALLLDALRRGTISPEDLERIIIVNSPEEVAAVVNFFLIKYRALSAKQRKDRKLLAALVLSAYRQVGTSAHTGMLEVY
jgi:uncharacterized protein (TIGR00730 family)